MVFNGAGVHSDVIRRDVAIGNGSGIRIGGCVCSSSGGGGSKDGGVRSSRSGVGVRSADCIHCNGRVHIDIDVRSGDGESDDGGVG